MEATKAEDASNRDHQVEEMAPERRKFLGNNEFVQTDCLHFSMTIVQLKHSLRFG